MKHQFLNIIDLFSDRKCHIYHILSSNISMKLYLDSSFCSTELSITTIKAHNYYSFIADEKLFF